MSGSGNDQEYGPDFLVSHDVILVTINYRLDALGFLSMDNKDVPGNAGMKDQNLALRWVHDNINEFGGDPQKVTILGQSAGSASVIYHMMSPMSKGLFQRGIAMSGVPFSGWAQPFEVKERAFKLGKILGKSTTNEKELLEFLQSVNVSELLNTVPAVISQELNWINPFVMFSFVPVVETDFGQDRFLVQSTKEALKGGYIQDKDLLLGYTSKEYSVGITKLANGVADAYNMFVDLKLPTEILREIPPKDIVPLANKIHERYFGNKFIGNETIAELVDFFDENLYTYSVNRFLKYLPDGKSHRYLYKFHLVSDRNRYKDFGTPYGISGCAHTDDLRYLFDAKADTTPIDVNSEEYRLVNQVCTLFTNFAKFG